MDENDKSGYYDDLINLIKKISDHIIKTKAAKERIGEAIMGGKVLTLPSDYIAQGYDKGVSDGSTTTVCKLVSDGDISFEKGSTLLGITVEQLKANMQNTGYDLPK